MFTYANDLEDFMVAVAYNQEHIYAATLCLRWRTCMKCHLQKYCCVLLSQIFIVLFHIELIKDNYIYPELSVRTFQKLKPFLDSVYQIFVDS